LLPIFEAPYNTTSQIAAPAQVFETKKA